MDADPRAPVAASGEIEVAATPEEVWGLLVAIDRYPDWNPDIREVRLDGPVQPGTRFSWKAGPGTIRSVLREVTPPTRLAWTGRTFGIRATHVYRVRTSEGGATVGIDESWDGLVAKTFRSRFRPTLQRAIDDGLAAVKATLEGGS